MNRSLWKRGCALAAALLVLTALPVAAAPEDDPDPTTTTSVSDPSQTTTTTTTITTTTTTTTTTSATTSAATATTTAAATTTTTAATATTTATAVTTATTATSTATTTTAADTEPTVPADTQPTVLATPCVIVDEPGTEDEYVYFCDTDGHYPADILNGARYEGYTDDWWVAGRRGGLALRLNSATGRYIRCSRYLFDGSRDDAVDAFTLSLWVNWQGNGEDDANLGQKLLCLSTQDLDDRWHTGDRLQWDPDQWYAFVSPHMRDAERGPDGICIRWENHNLYESGEDFSEAEADTTFALPTNEWHHIAVTMTDTAFTLYVDGHRLYSCVGTTELATMAPFLDRFFIGRGMEGDPTLDALIDDALLYPQALTDEQIALLAADRDPAEGTAPTAPDYQPTRPADTAATATTAATRGSLLSSGDSGFPVAIVAIPAAVLLITVVLSLVFSRKTATDDGEPTTETDNVEPTAETDNVEPTGTADTDNGEPTGTTDTDEAAETVEPEEDA